MKKFLSEARSWLLALLIISATLAVIGILIWLFGLLNYANEDLRIIIVGLIIISAFAYGLIKLGRPSSSSHTAKRDNYEEVLNNSADKDTYKKELIKEDMYNVIKSKHSS